jgi:hypothetical protein
VLTHQLVKLNYTSGVSVIIYDLELPIAHANHQQANSHPYKYAFMQTPTTTPTPIPTHAPMLTNIDCTHTHTSTHANTHTHTYTGRTRGSWLQGWVGCLTPSSSPGRLRTVLPLVPLERQTGLHVHSSVLSTKGCKESHIQCCNVNRSRGKQVCTCISEEAQKVASKALYSAPT